MKRKSNSSILTQRLLNYMHFRKSFYFSYNIFINDINNKCSFPFLEMTWSDSNFSIEGFWQLNLKFRDLQTISFDLDKPIKEHLLTQTKELTYLTQIVSLNLSEYCWNTINLSVYARSRLLELFRFCDTVKRIFQSLYRFL